MVTGGQMHTLEVGTMTEFGCYTTGTESLILTMFFSSGQTCAFTLYVFLQLFMLYIVQSIGMTLANEGHSIALIKRDRGMF
jgi:hypothetical protein